MNYRTVKIIQPETSANNVYQDTLEARKKANRVWQSKRTRRVIAIPEALYCLVEITSVFARYDQTQITIKYLFYYVMIVFIVYL